MIARLSLAAFLLLGALGCDGGEDPGDGAVTPGMDGSTSPGPDGAPPPGPDGSPPPTGDAGCELQVEICGDRMDQNCDGRDQSCGDNDGDGVEACREGDDLTLCDCDDTRTDVRPPFGGSVPGAPELCDGLDNDCDGRIDESAECCAGCEGIEPSRADRCDEAGQCDCSTASGVGPCPEGSTCCSTGCVDIQTDFDNCGLCGTRCTPSADRCTAGECRCGDGPVCDLTFECTGGACGG